MAIAGDIVPSKVGEGLATSDRSISPKAIMLAGTGQHVARGDTVHLVLRASGPPNSNDTWYCH